jgi:hypothetical protein
MCDRLGGLMELMIVSGIRTRVLVVEVVCGPAMLGGKW